MRTVNFIYIFYEGESFVLVVSKKNGLSIIGAFS